MIWFKSGGVIIVGLLSLTIYFGCVAQQTQEKERIWRNKFPSASGKTFYELIGKLVLSNYFRPPKTFNLNITNSSGDLISSSKIEVSIDFLPRPNTFFANDAGEFVIQDNYVSDMPFQKNFSLIFFYDYGKKNIRLLNDFRRYGECFYSNNTNTFFVPHLSSSEGASDILLNVYSMRGSLLWRKNLYKSKRFLGGLWGGTIEILDRENGVNIRLAIPDNEGRNLIEYIYDRSGYQIFKKIKCEPTPLITRFK